MEVPILPRLAVNVTFVPLIFKSSPALASRIDLSEVSTTSPEVEAIVPILKSSTYGRAVKALSLATSGITWFVLLKIIPS